MKILELPLKPLRITKVLQRTNKYRNQGHDRAKTEL